jgi:hypothetical protein
MGWVECRARGCLKTFKLFDMVGVLWEWWRGCWALCCEANVIAMRPMSVARRAVMYIGFLVVRLIDHWGRGRLVLRYYMYVGVCKIRIIDCSLFAAAGRSIVTIRSWGVKR